MILRRKIISALIAIVLISGTVYLGIQSGKDNRFVICFGLASAIVGPVGLNLFTYAKGLAVRMYPIKS